MTEHTGFDRFVSLQEHDAPGLLERMSSRELPVDGQRYGIVTRLIARPGVQVIDLAAAVLRKLLENSPVSPAELGGIVLSSRIQDPAAAARQVADQLDLTCPAQGIERACSGFPAATRISMRLCRRTRRPVAVISAEIISRSINWEPAQGDLKDQRRARGQAAKLFGDGAAAVIIGPVGTDHPHMILDAWQGDVPDEQQLIQKSEVLDALDPWGRIRPGSTTCMSMPGRRGYWLVKRAPQIMADAVRHSVEQTRRVNLVGEEQVSHIVPHQANGLILSRLQRQLGGAQGPVNVWNCIEHMGNTVSASIPLAMSQIQQRIPPGSLVAMPSVGAGGPGYRPAVLSTGCVLMRTGEAG